MRLLLVLAFVSLVLAIVPAPAHATARTTVYTRTIAAGTAGNEQSSFIVMAPAGYSDLRFALACGTSVGTVLLEGADVEVLFTCPGANVSRDPLQPGVSQGEYDATATITSVSGATLTLSGIAR